MMFRSSSPSGSKSGSTASASSAEELARWNKTMELMDRGITKMFCNDFSGAEEVFLEGMKLKRKNMDMGSDDENNVDDEGEESFQAEDVEE